ncbi:MAG: hypothetical protein AAF430_19175, partial [Myxococcota bacterium]
MASQKWRWTGAAGVGLALVASGVSVPATTTDDLDASLTRGIDAVEERVVAWRRDFHQHPELSNREVRTAGKVAEHLRALGLEVRTEIAHTG